MQPAPAQQVIPDNISNGELINLLSKDGPALVVCGTEKQALIDAIRLVYEKQGNQK